MRRIGWVPSCLRPVADGDDEIAEADDEIPSLENVEYEWEQRNKLRIELALRGRYDHGGCRRLQLGLHFDYVASVQERRLILAAAARMPKGPPPLVAASVPGRPITRLVMASSDDHVVYVQGFLDDGSALPAAGSAEGCTQFAEVTAEGCFTTVFGRSNSRGIYSLMGFGGREGGWRSWEGGCRSECDLGCCIAGYVASAPATGEVKSGPDIAWAARDHPFGISFLEGPILPDVKPGTMSLKTATIVPDSYAAPAQIISAANAAEQFARAATNAGKEAARARGAAGAMGGTSLVAADIKQAAACCGQAVAAAVHCAAAAKDAASQAVLIERQCQELDAAPPGIAWEKVPAVPLSPFQGGRKPQVDDTQPAASSPAAAGDQPVANKLSELDQAAAAPLPPADKLLLPPALKVLQKANRSVILAAQAAKAAARDVLEQLSSLEVKTMISIQDCSATWQAAADLAAVRHRIAAARAAATGLVSTADYAVATVTEVAASEALAEQLQALLPSVLLAQPKQQPGWEPPDKKQQPGWEPPDKKQQTGWEPPDRKKAEAVWKRLEQLWRGLLRPAPDITSGRVASTAATSPGVGFSATGNAAAAAAAGSSTGKQQQQQQQQGSAGHMLGSSSGAAAAAGSSVEITPEVGTRQGAGAASNSQGPAAGSSMRPGLDVMAAAVDALQDVVEKGKELQQAVAAFGDAVVVAD